MYNRNRYTETAHKKHLNTVELSQFYTMKWIQNIEKKEFQRGDLNLKRRH